MGWILMQPEDDSVALKAALALLRSEGGTCNFDVIMNGARLHPIRFGSRSCTERERHYHSFISEAGCSRWAITRHYDNPLITQHLTVTLRLYTADHAAQSAAYNPAVFHSHDPFKCLSTAPSIVPVPLFRALLFPLLLPTPITRL